MNIQALVESLREFATLCPWLEDEWESGVGTMTPDDEVVLEGDGFNSDDFVTAGMIRSARKTLDCGSAVE